jgi:hypothetical protein
MSEKKRQKKDGERKDKKNQAMRDSVSERHQQAGSPQATDDDRNLRESGTGATDRARKEGGNS